MGPEEGATSVSPQTPVVVANAAEEMEDGRGSSPVLAFPADGFQVQKQSFFLKLYRQVSILLWKNLILLTRSRWATFFRMIMPFIFLFFAWVTATAVDSANKVNAKPHPPIKELTELSKCKNPKGETECLVIAYAPAPFDMYRVTAAEPTAEELRAFNAEEIEELKRAHKAIKAVVDKYELPTDQVMGFMNETGLDGYISWKAGKVQAGVVIEARSLDNTQFRLKLNSTRVQNGEKVQEGQFVTMALPLQVAISEALSNTLDPNGQITGFEFDVDYKEMPIPEQKSEGVPDGFFLTFFLFVGSVFPFTVQMFEVTRERELKLRQSMASMGMTELAYWLSWHIFHMLTGILGSILMIGFGAAFDFDTFTRNGFGVMFFTLFFFHLSMTGMGYCLSNMLTSSMWSIAVGFAMFIFGWICYQFVAFGLPWSTYDHLDAGRDWPYLTYYSYVAPKDLWGNPGGSGEWKYNKYSPIPVFFGFLPFPVFVHSIMELSQMSEKSGKGYGLYMNNVTSYCKLNASGTIPDVNNTYVFCDPDFSVGNTWAIQVGQYLFYTFLGLYLENVLPDAMGQRKPWAYPFMASYWGFTQPAISSQPAEVIEASEDADVIEEEQRVAQRVGQPMAATSSVEVRGLRKTFRRGGVLGGGKKYDAVKCPQFAIDRNKLFCLLGPNGAGKTTVINMLTGVIMPTSGEALVDNNTITHPKGMANALEIMGVCPQFDLLFESLTALEHLTLFGVLKGIPSNSLMAQCSQRLEEVRLGTVTNTLAGNFSGGMKRRLSVSIALLGNPAVVFLDEPTTGMDPINRRHVWDIIEQAKADRAVVLTTHSMEEADILGDRIGIMAKGRLRCLGSSTHLKSKFGSGYRFIASIDKKKANSQQISEAFGQVQGRLVSTSEHAVIFEVPASQESGIPGFYRELESNFEALGITGIQMNMSSLEDVFLEISKRVEIEEAQAANKTVPVTLPNGKRIQVPFGSEEPQNVDGQIVKVKWGLDADGRLMPVDIENADSEVTLEVTCPDGCGPGSLVAVEHEGRTHHVKVPMSTEPGQKFQATLSTGGAQVAVSISNESYDGQGPPTTESELRQRINDLRPTFVSQGKTLFKKNLKFQRKLRCANCCIFGCPSFVLILVFVVQFIVENSFGPIYEQRCTYCGPKDDSFGKSYCAGKTCSELFFPLKDLEIVNSQYREWKEDFGMEEGGYWVQSYGLDEATYLAGRAQEMATCDRIAETCVGDGHISCFWRQNNFSFGNGRCPDQQNEWESSEIVSNAKSANAPRQLNDRPVAFTATDSSGAKDVLSKMYLDSSWIEADTKAEIRLALDQTLTTMYTALLLPVAGCGQFNTTDFNSAFTIEPALPEVAQKAYCKFLQHGNREQKPCCFDLSVMNTSEAGNIEGFNYWSDGSGSVAASGRGKANLVSMMQRLNTNEMHVWGFDRFSSVSDLIRAVEPTFSCVRPEYTTELRTALPDLTCINPEEGFAIIANKLNLEPHFHPDPEPTKGFPECHRNGDCGTYGGRGAQVCEEKLYELGLHRFGQADVSYLEPLPSSLGGDVDAYQQWKSQNGYYCEGWDEWCKATEFTRRSADEQAETTRSRKSEGDRVKDLVAGSMIMPGQDQAISKLLHTLSTVSPAPAPRDARPSESTHTSSPQRRNSPTQSWSYAAKVFAASQLPPDSPGRLPCVCMATLYMKALLLEGFGGKDFLRTQSVRYADGSKTDVVRLATQPDPTIPPHCQGQDLWTEPCREYNGLAAQAQDNMRELYPFKIKGFQMSFEERWGDQQAKMTIPQYYDEQKGNWWLRQPGWQRKYDCVCYDSDRFGGRFCHPGDGSNQNCVCKGMNGNVNPPEELANCQPKEFYLDQNDAALRKRHLLVKDCREPEVFEFTCFLQMWGNISRRDIECQSMGDPEEHADNKELDDALFLGWYDRNDKTSGEDGYIRAYDVKSITSNTLDVTVYFNQSAGGTTDDKGRLKGYDDLSQSINDLLSTFVSDRFNRIRPEGPQFLLAIENMPTAAAWGKAQDVGSLVGTSFFHFTFSVMFPVMVVTLVMEREYKMRHMMRMMGLGSLAYWTINFVFWMSAHAIFFAFWAFFVGVIELPSGYKIGLFNKVDGGVQFLVYLFFSFSNVSFAFLWSILIPRLRVAQILSVLWVLLTGGFGRLLYIVWNSEGVSESVKTLITLPTHLALTRVIVIYVEYNLPYNYGERGPALTWDEITPGSPMATTLTILGLEGPIMLLLALYFDEVLPSGMGVPKHPLFMFGMRWKEESVNVPDDEYNAPEDVQVEEGRVRELTGKDRLQQDVVMCQNLKKIYPSKPPKCAVRDLTVGIKRGECLGMLGPNGAGKTSAINMIVGFQRPTSGFATVESFDIRTQMDSIYAIMGVCPQHDLLWMSLTAQEHLEFYGALKNLRGAVLQAAIDASLNAVNLLDVKNVAAGTFSGGMKRRLSVAISLIGNPLICFLDEPSTGLDPASRRLLWSCIKKAKQKCAMLLTTHSMEEAEGLCDRISIFVDGRLRCIGEPRDLTHRYGGIFVLSIVQNEGFSEEEIHKLARKLSPSCRETYALAGTFKFELNATEAKLDNIFEEMVAGKARGLIKSWGITSTTMEEVFIRIATQSGAGVDNNVP